MYQGKIEAEREIDIRAALEPPSQPAPRHALLLGVVVLTIGLPLLVMRLFFWGIGQQLRGLRVLARTLGEAAVDAARQP